MHSAHVLIYLIETVSIYFMVMGKIVSVRTLIGRGVSSSIDDGGPPFRIYRSLDGREVMWPIEGGIFFHSSKYCANHLLFNAPR